MTNINELLDGYVSLEVECIDRLYLSGYVAGQGRGGLHDFLSKHRGLPSPALLGQISRHFVERLCRYAEERETPIIQSLLPLRRGRRVWSRVL